MNTANRGPSTTLPTLGCLALVFWAACGDGQAGNSGSTAARPEPSAKGGDTETADSGERDTLYFGAGCFWCTEAGFRQVPGVREVTVGYQGGHTPNPNYGEVCSGTSGHAEVARVVYDPRHTNLNLLFDVFWTVHDPTTLNRQGADVGTQYRSVIFHTNSGQATAAVASRDKVQARLADTIVTQILPAPVFHPAEEDHQEYFLNNPDAGYCRMVIAPKVKKVEKLLKGDGHQRTDSPQ